jgi:hypothetical protein
MSMTQTRRVVMVAFVASALCADRMASAAAPLVRPEVVCVARRITTRLAASFRHTVPAARLLEEQALKPIAPARPTLAVNVPATFFPVEVSPFQFRLPPPLV